MSNFIDILIIDVLLILKSIPNVISKWTELLIVAVCYVIGYIRDPVGITSHLSLSSGGGGAFLVRYFPDFS